MATNAEQDNSQKLQRTIRFPMLVLYGMGTMVGAGFYALAFAELSARLPHAGGSARYVEEAFGKKWLSALLGG